MNSSPSDSNKNDVETSWDAFIHSVENSKLFDDEVTKLFIAMDLEEAEVSNKLSEFQTGYLLRKLGHSYRRERDLRATLVLKALTLTSAWIVNILGVTIAVTSILPLREKITPFFLSHQTELVLFAATITLAFTAYRFKKSSDDADHLFSSLSNFEVVETKK